MRKTTGTACTPYKFVEEGTKLDTKGKERPCILGDSIPSKWGEGSENGI